VGVDPGFLVRVLQGKQPPSQKILTGVTEAFDLPPDHFVEVRRETLAEMLSTSPTLVDAFYNQVARRGSGDLVWSAGIDERLDPMTILMHSDSSDQRFVEIAAAMLLRYQDDADFRAAVDTQLPATQRLAQVLHEASDRSRQPRG